MTPQSPTDSLPTLAAEWTTSLHLSSGSPLKLIGHIFVAGDLVCS